MLQITHEDSVWIRKYIPTHVTYVNTHTHTYTPCVRTRKHVHTHMYYLCTYTWTNTHTEGKPLSIYVNICTHTCKLRACMCKSARPHVKFPSTTRPPPIAYCRHPSPLKKAQPTLIYHPMQATPILFAFAKGKGSTGGFGQAHTLIKSGYKHVNIYTHTHKLFVHTCTHIHTHVNSVCIYI